LTSWALQVHGDLQGKDSNGVTDANVSELAAFAEAVIEDAEERGCAWRSGAPRERFRAARGDALSIEDAVCHVEERRQDGR
jgi:hypothetical protein